jgi:iron-sulfur cluster repair protein YtfE (RIC family)
LRTVADSIANVLLEVMRRGVDETYGFLAHHLIPHAFAKDTALYPVADRLLGAPGATSTMSSDHVEVGWLTDEFALLHQQLGISTVNEVVPRELRRVLSSLYALVKLHVAKEEKIDLPLFDARLSVDEAQRTFTGMEEAAREAKRQPAV